MQQNDNYLFCEGIGCPLKNDCRCYVSGLGVDRNAVGYSWAAACDTEDYDGYLPVSPAIHSIQR